MSVTSWYEIPEASRAPRRRAVWLAVLSLLAFGADPPAIYYTADLWWRTAEAGWRYCARNGVDSTLGKKPDASHQKLAGEIERAWLDQLLREVWRG